MTPKRDYMVVGIYQIVNKINNKKYIGQSVEVERRLKKHKTYLNGNYHSNTHLQDSFNKYGEDNFKFEIIEVCEEEELDNLEKFYISTLKTTNPNYGYNYESGGNENKRLSEETKQKMSESQKGRIVSDETRRKIGDANRGINNGMYGKPLSEETKQKISEANKGRIVSEETKKKLSEVNKGKKLSEEQKEKISKNRRGKCAGEDNHNFGKTLDFNTKIKLSESHNTTGYFRVQFCIDDSCSTGYRYRYRWCEYNINKSLSAYSINDLKEKVLKKELPWFKIDEDLALKTDRESKERMQLFLDNKYDTGIFGVIKEKCSSVKQGFRWTFYSTELKYNSLQSTDLNILKEKVLNHGLEWKIINEKNAEQSFELNKKLLLIPKNKPPKYSIWDTSKVKYFKSEMIKRGRVPNPVKCFAINYKSKRVKCGNFIDFVTPTIIHNLIIEFTEQNINK